MCFEKSGVVLQEQVKSNTWRTLVHDNALLSDNTVVTIDPVSMPGPPSEAAHFPPPYTPARWSYGANHCQSARQARPVGGVYGGGKQAASRCTGQTCRLDL